MTASLASLRAPFTVDQVRQRILSGLTAAGFPVSDWAPTSAGGIENGIIDAVAGTLANLGAQKLADAISSGFLDFGRGAWLAFWAKQFYLVEKNAATSTIQAITIKCAPDAGPYTVAVGDLIVIAAGSATGANRYRNIEGGVIPSGAGVLRSIPEVIWQFQAENPGSAYSDPPDTILTLVTSLAGVLIRNSRILTPSPAALVTGGGGRGQVIPYQSTPGTPPRQDRFRIRITKSGQVTGAAIAQFVFSTDDGATWSSPQSVASLLDLPGGCSVSFLESVVTGNSFLEGDVYFWGNVAILQQGSDEESDARLAGRCRARWLTLSDVPSSGTVELWAKLAAPEVARVRVVSDPNAANRALVYIASSAGPAAPATVVAVQAFISARLDPNEAANVLSVSTRAIPVAGGVSVPRLALAAVQTKAQALWSAYLAGIETGGTARLAELEQAVIDAGAVDYSGLRFPLGLPVWFGIAIGGTNGTMQFQVALNNTDFSDPPLQTVAGVYVYKVPGTLLTVSFTNITWVKGNEYRIGADGVVTAYGAGALSSDITFVENAVNVVLATNEVAVEPDGRTLINSLSWDPV